MAIVRTTLREALKSGLESITTAAGYWITLQRVYDPPRNKETFAEFPAVNILWGREERVGGGTELGGRLAGNNPLIDLRLSCQLDVYLNKPEDPNEEVDKVIASIQKYFGNYWYVPDTNGDRTVFVSVYASAEPWGTDVQEIVGVSVGLDIWYSIRLTDPESMT